MSDSPPATASDSLDRGDERYTYERELGRGSMGAVFLVRDRETGERLALKKLYRMDGKTALRVKREFRLLADLSHANLVKLYELARARDGWFLTMEYVRGEDLSSYAERERGDKTRSRLDAAMPALLAQGTAPHLRLLPVFYQLACGVHGLHRAGMLHRDLKPSNVLVTNQRVVVLDFGLVRELERSDNAVTEEGAIAGTPAYMAPEQTLAQPLSEATDWYAFGVMLYEALTGKLPIDGTPAELLRYKHVHDPLAPERLDPKVPASLSRLCMALLARDPVARPSGNDVLARLESVGRELSLDPVSQSLADISVHTETQTRVATVPLFGREDELAVLWEAMRSAEDGHTAVVHVHGTSGAGKSALIERFLDEIEQSVPPFGQDAPLVLRGRCYEREAMPFKALDSVIDALSRHLARLDDFQVSNLLPSDITALAQLFPVLERLSAVQRLLSLSKRRGDAVGSRKRAEEALRELFVRIAARGPVVVWIDDLQWGDLDSAGILKGWLQRAADVSLLLVFSYRSDEVETSECLQSLLRGVSRHTQVPVFEKDVEVGPLAEQDVEALCRGHFAERGRGGDELIAHIVRESAGSPFLANALLALADVKLARGEANLQQLSISDLVAQTDELLPSDAKHLLAVLAVAGRPIVPKLAFRATGLRRGGRELVHSLRNLRLVRTRDVAGERLLEIYHDRVRESVQRMLSGSQLQRIHASLLSALEYGGCTDADWLHALALGAGRSVAALRYGIVAAERASAALAFERAAELFARCLELGELSAPERAALLGKLGYALGCCARGATAADAYLEAAKLAPEQEAVGLMRLAASHLLRSGHFARGEALLKDVLLAMKLSVPETDSGLKAAIAWERLRVGARGLSYTPRGEHQIPAEVLARIDAFDALRWETGAIDPVRSAFLQAREQRWALEAGEPTRVLRALGGACYIAATAGSERAERRVDELLGSAQALANQIGTPLATSIVRGTQAMSFFMLARDRAVLEPSYEAERLYRALVGDASYGHYYYRFMVVSARIGALYALGEYRRFAQELESALQEAHSAENVCALLGLALNETLLDEILGRPDAAKARLERQREQLPEGRYGVYHALNTIASMCAGCAGDHAWGVEIMQRDWQRYLRSAITRSAQLSLLARGMRIRLLLNHHIAERTVAGVAPLLDAELRACSALRPKAIATGVTLALRARLSHAQGKTETAIELLRAAMLKMRTTDRAGDVARTGYALGCLVGGDEGKALRRSSTSFLQNNGVPDPLSYLHGYWPELREKG